MGIKKHLKVIIKILEIISKTLQRMEQNQTRVERIGQPITVSLDSVSAIIEENELQQLKDDKNHFYNEMIKARARVKELEIEIGFSCVPGDQKPKARTWHEERLQADYSLKSMTERHKTLDEACSQLMKDKKQLEQQLRDLKRNSEFRESLLKELAKENENLHKRIKELDQLMSQNGVDTMPTNGRQGWELNDLKTFFVGDSPIRGVGPGYSKNTEETKPINTNYSIHFSNLHYFLVNELKAYTSCWYPNELTTVTYSEEAGRICDNIFQKFTTVKHAMEILRFHLRTDQGFRTGWEANIAMSFVDYVEKANPENRVININVHELANSAAKLFIDKLVK